MIAFADAMSFAASTAVIGGGLCVNTTLGGGIGRFSAALTLLMKLFKAAIAFDVFAGVAFSGRIANRNEPSRFENPAASTCAIRFCSARTGPRYAGLPAAGPASVAMMAVAW